jgi:hypothetical protein
VGLVVPILGIAFEAGKVINTSFALDENGTKLPAFEDERTVSRDKVGPVVEYVPIPTSQSDVETSKIE